MLPTTPFSEGEPSSPILLIGESPSFEELREQRPFVGQAGRLLDLTLHSAKIVRADVCIINTFETATHKKDDDAKIFSKDGELLWTPTRGFTDAGIIASEPARKRMRESSANVIVPLGGVATSLALGAPRSVMKWRGTILVNDIGRKVVVTIHPAYVLRGAYQDRFLLIADLQKAKAESHDPNFTPSKRSLIIDPDFATTRNFLVRSLDAAVVNTDIEILRGQVDCFSVALSPAEAISIPLIDAGFEHRWSPEEEAEIWSLYAQILSAPHIAKVNQNITFDLAALLQLNNIVPQGVLHDPMVAHSIIYPALRKDLGTLCSLYTRQSYYKDQGELHDSIGVDDFARRWNYSALDSAISLECWNTLQPMIEEGGYQRTYDMTMALVPSLVYMMTKGIRVDTTALVETRLHAEREIKTLVARLAELFERPVITEAPKRAADKRAAAGAININSPAQLMAWFYDHLKLPAYHNQIGARSIDDKALARIYRRDGRAEAKLLQEYRGLAKMLSTTLSVELDEGEDGARVKSSFSLRGAWTGRLSSSKTIFNRGLNFQNLTPEFRNFLVADG